MDGKFGTFIALLLIVGLLLYIPAKERYDREEQKLIDSINWSEIQSWLADD